MTEKILCHAFLEDFIDNDYLRVGPNCANSSCCFPITSHPRRPGPKNKMANFFNI